MRIPALLTLCAAALCAPACDDEGDEVTTVELPHGCKWGAFEATVREGPNAPMTLEGTLVIAGVDDTLQEIGGMLMVDEDNVVPVMGRLLGDEVELRFVLAQGTIVGRGQLGADGDLCEEGLEGDLEGPTAGDTGDWLGAGITSYADPSATYELGSGGNIGSTGNDGFTYNVTEQVSGSCTKTTSPISSGSAQTYSVLTCKNGGATCKFFYGSDGVLFLDRCYDASGAPIKKPGES